jgi:hypothetical protein
VGQAKGTDAQAGIAKEMTSRLFADQQLFFYGRWLRVV